MQSDFLDRKLYKMAEQEQMAVSEDLDARVDDILQHLEKNGRGSRHHYSFRRAAILAAACLVLASATVTASGMYQARMESMNHEKLEEYFAQLQEANVSADTYSRPMTENETARLEELRQAYLEQGYFPKKELTLIDNSEKYKKGVATTRVGADYHDKRLGTNQCSAIAIRQSVAAGHDLSYLASQMPENAYEILRTSLEEQKPLFADDFSAALQYKLLTEYSAGYDKYQDISSDLSDRIRNTLPSFTGLSSFCDLLKSKDMTYTRISRCLFHILLNMTKEEFETCKSEDYISYARVLGFCKDAAPLLTEIKKNSSIPLITSLADARQTLPADALRMLDQDILRNQIYLGHLALKNKKEMVNEYRTPIVIV